jgi:hypothetical protein
MAISLSTAVLEAMGFRPLSSAELISARFHALHVYAIQGVVVGEASLPARIGAIAGRPYQLAVGASVNAVCRTLVDDDLADSEQEWQKQHKCTPPYLVVHLGPTEEHNFAGTHAKMDEPTISTYDGFPRARGELHAWAEEVLPSLFAGLASSFSLHDQPVKFVPTDRVFYGITIDGRTVIDTRVSVSASAYGSTRLSAEQAAERLASAMNIASGMKQKVARFFHLALHEDDPLKRFLYFFLAIEIETHATFSTIDHARQFSSLVLPPAHVAVTTQAFFDGQRQKWTNLMDRFVWCVICAWPHLSDLDAEEFKRLKTIRDEIAHGSLATPPADAVRAVEKLAAKLQLPAP